MIRQNIGIINAMLRITCGLTFLSCSTVRMIRHPKRQGSFLLAIMAAMKVAEGIVRYCPVTDAISKFTESDNENEQSNKAINP